MGEAMNIGIIGQGFVGNAVYNKFKNFFNVFTFDIKSNLCNSELEDIKEKCKVIFICVPTPMNKNGSCDFSIVESTINDLSTIDDLLVINKSTIPPGTTEYLNLKYPNIQIIFNPEFLTERNAVEDFNNQTRIILGGPRPGTTIAKNIFMKVFPKAQIIKTGSKHAEMVKYLTNAFLATKVSFANEIYDYCTRLDIDYDKVIEYSIIDNRLGNSHWGVPGHDGDFGFGGHCFPKDLSGIIYETKKIGSLNNVLNAAKETNDIVRKNRDWENMKGRAIN